MGVYPLLRDETCWFLAADFDGANWTPDVGAFVATCRVLGVPPAIERSRSGEGAHAWFFFEAPVRAAVARQFGCYLLTETMGRRYELSMKSYDRLFPNQDTMPRGGYGNLIALPLQYEARERGNTVFVDETWHPYSDQWAYLASQPTLRSTTVEEIAQEAVRQGGVLGVRWQGVEDEDAATRPWSRPPSGAHVTGIIEPLPAEVRAVLAQRLFVEKGGLPSSLLNEIKRLAAFQNPEFYKKQSLRFSTATTPRVITCAEELPNHIALPRGCRSDVEGLLGSLGASLVVDDQRSQGESVDFEFHGHLTPVQQEAFDAVRAHDTGVLVAPPGLGKTVLGTALIASRARSALVLVHRQPLLDQWVSQLAKFLELDPKAIGVIRGGKRTPTGRLDVAMMQSLVHKGSVDDLVASYGQVIVDECHHVPAVTFERLLAEVRARFVLGLTAIATRRDGHHPILLMQLGPVRFAVHRNQSTSERVFRQRVVVRETTFRSSALDASASIQELYAALAADEARNALILDDVIGALEEGRSPILLTERTGHLEYFAERLRSFTKHLVVLRGGMTARQRREIQSRLSEIPAEEERLLLATGRYIGEGFDDARLDTLFLALPISWKGTLAQYAGRLQRVHPGKTEVRVFDYVDLNVLMLRRMFAKRLKGYKTLGYTVLSTPPDTSGSEKPARGGK